MSFLCCSEKHVVTSIDVEPLIVHLWLSASGQLAESCVYDKVGVGTKTDGKQSAMILTRKILKVCDQDCYWKEHMSSPTGNANADKMKNIKIKKVM